MITSTPADDSRPSSDGRPEGEANHEKALADELLPGMSSLAMLIEAYKHGNSASRQSVREDFVARNGKILNAYFAPNVDACVVQVERLGRPRAGCRLLVWLDRRDLAFQVPEFANEVWRVLWIARSTERESESMMSRRSRGVVAEILFTIAVFLVGNLDATRVSTDQATETLQRAASSAKLQLDKLEQYIDRAAIRGALKHYLFGLPVGAALLIGPVVLMLALGDLDSGVRSLLVISVIAGGIGSIASVMFRITRGQKLSIDIQQGPLVTLVAGTFRPIIGAIFGAAIYVMVAGGIIPLSVPNENSEHFYAGLAFLAGFSERWAQDTIVRSAPVAPSPATIRTPASQLGPPENDARSYPT
jgi:hypothetical protein